LIFGEERGIFSDRRVVGAVDRKDETEEITGFAGSKERADDTALAKKLHELETEISKQTRYETVVYVARGGRELYRKCGDRAGVTSNRPDLIAGNVVTHNHPSGINSLSLDDVRTFLNNDGYEIRAVTNDGLFASLKKDESAGSRKDDLLKEVKKLFSEGDMDRFEEEMWVKAEAIYGTNPTKTQYKQTLKLYVNNWYSNNVSKYGYIFSEGEF
jgi:hypothetical protein